MKSLYTGRSHLNLQNVNSCEVKNSFFKGSNYLGSGAIGYGAELSRHTTGCKIENNQFEHLRHALLIHNGASLNAILYNTSTESWGKNSEGQSFKSADILMHGYHPANNLVEGNTVEYIAFDRIHGTNLPGNIIYKNCIKKRGIGYATGSDGQFIIANIFSPSNYGSINQIFTQDNNAFEFTNMLITANYIGDLNDVIMNDETNYILPNSLIYNEKPDFINDVWPKFEPFSLSNCLN